MFNKGDKVVIVSMSDCDDKVHRLASEYIGTTQTITKVFNVGVEDEHYEINLGGDFGLWWFEPQELKEETKMKPWDTVKVKGCTEHKAKYNGMTGLIIGNEKDWNDQCPHRMCFDGTGTSCGWLFADSELEVIPQAPQFAVGDKVTVMDCSYSCEFADGKVINVQCGEPNKGIHEITELGKVLPAADQSIYNDSLHYNDTIIRRISDGRVFFVQRRFLKAYVAVPKFHKDQICECDDEYCRVVKVNNDLTYVITMQPSIYKDGSADIVVDESELSEVAQ